MAADTDRLEKSMNPEAVSTRLVAAHDLRRIAQTEAPFRARDLILESVRVAGVHTPLAGPVPDHRREPELPLATPQFEREEQNLVTFLPAGRLRGLHRSSLVDVISQRGA